MEDMVAWELFALRICKSSCDNLNEIKIFFLSKYDSCNSRNINNNNPNFTWDLDVHCKHYCMDLLQDKILHFSSI